MIVFFAKIKCIFFKLMYKACILLDFTESNGAEENRERHGELRWQDWKQSITYCSRNQDTTRL